MFPNTSCVGPAAVPLIYRIGQTPEIKAEPDCRVMLNDPKVLTQLGVLPILDMFWCWNQAIITLVLIGNVSSQSFVQRGNMVAVVVYVVVAVVLLVVVVLVHPLSGAEKPFEVDQVSMKAPVGVQLEIVFILASRAMIFIPVDRD